MFRRIKTSWKLFFLLCIPLAALCFFAYIAVHHLNKVSDDLVQVLYRQDYVTLDLISKTQSEMYEALVAEHTLLYTESQNARFDSLKTSIDLHVHNAQTYVEKARTLATQDENVWKLAKHPQTQRTIFQNFDDFDSNFRTWAMVSSAMIDKLSHQQSVFARQEAVGKIDEVDYTFQAAQGSIAETKEILDTIAGQAIQLQDTDRTQALSTVWSTVALVLVLVTVCAVLLVRSMRKSLRQTLAVTERVARGNLRESELPPMPADEIGKLAVAAQGMVHHLRELIEQVTHTAEQVAASSQQMTANAEAIQSSTTQIADELEQLAQGAEIQAQSTDQISQAMEEMGHGIHRIAETSVLVTQAAVETADEADAGQESIQQAVHQMHSISDVTDRSADKVRRLGQHSSAIGQFVGAITAISRQTNLLALNASIEAARAGEHGRGFAVVADEVRKLAVQSQESAKQIEGLIVKMQKDTTETVQAMDDVLREVHSGIVAVDVAGDAFQRIMTKSHLVADQILEIRKSAELMFASSEQAAASSQETAHIAHLTASRSQNCADEVELQLTSMDELYKLSEGLNQLAQEVEVVLKRFEM
ncbi:methyl-accepting chemotaxis protein [Tumebacillus permanentifrigoris]|uniref:Methyl-accepting chemotaxis protein n=1 Tax=Tumebacillus permanentifrigoris TaxID=378543 RepID=A0A316D9P1_9BACL|nr:methyl-accepting chemotaxis protein [Tumebacillus permanentifrigoris]PWK13460.1 methyl-accepting chemotaxis protein [Tumebacillus permanentifrigoris]